MKKKNRRRNDIEVMTKSVEVYNTAKNKLKAAEDHFRKATRYEVRKKLV